MSNKVHPHNFYPVQKYWSMQQFLNTLNNIYVNKFQFSVFLQRVYLGSTQNLTIARSLCTKVCQGLSQFSFLFFGKF